MQLASPLHRANLRALCAALTLIALAAPAARAAVGDLYVTSDATDITDYFSGTTGNALGNFTSSNASIGQMAIHFGANNNRALIGHNYGGVEEFDATTGAYIKTYNPGGGWMWAGVYAPNGDVLAGDMTTGDIRRYNSATGALIGVFLTVPDPSDMEYGPGGRLFICSFTQPFVREADPNTGFLYSMLNLPANTQANDVCFNPAMNELLVTDMRLNKVYRYGYPGYAPMGSFAGTNWGRPHGITINPHNGRVMVVDGVTAQVHVFNQFTYAEIDASFLFPDPGLKIVDLAFRPGSATPVQQSTWGRVKALYKR